MKIVVNDIAASGSGAMTVLRDFYEYVCENDHENQWIFLLNDRYFEETDNVKILTLPAVKRNPFRKLLFDFITGRKYIGALQPDVVFSLQNIITFGMKVPQVAYIHQSIPFQTVKRFSFLKASERKMAVIQYLIGAVIKRSAKKSSKVITQTRWIKDAICSQCGLPEDKVVTVAPDVVVQMPDVAETQFDRTSFFYPSTPAIYKNNECILQASAILDREEVPHKIVLTLPAEQSKGNVDCVGRLPYQEVLERYTSTTLLFPSYIETFGYPLAEARKMGAIVLASDCPFSREVLDGYENAYYFDPFCPEALAELMKKVVSGEIERKMISPEKLQEKNSWQTVIEQVLTCK